MKIKLIIATILSALYAVMSAQSLQETIHAVTDKDCYLAGERLHISVCITDTQNQSSPYSKVAYVEICDTENINAQGMVSLIDGRGWADIALPATMHSGNYLLSVYTRAMRNDNASAPFRKIVSIVNALRVTHKDDITFVMPNDSNSIKDEPAIIAASASPADSTLQIAIPDFVRNSTFCTLSVVGDNISTPLYSTENISIANRNQASTYLPEIEGHLVTAECDDIYSEADVTRLVMVGKKSLIFDGQKQSSKKYTYYTNEANGTLATLINAYDTEGKAVKVHLVSPYAKMLPDTLPHLTVNCHKQQLVQRSICAQREQALTNRLALDSLEYTNQILSATPDYEYDLDEWTKFDTVNDILLEFVNGIRKKDDQQGITQLYTHFAGTKQYSRIPALVLLDGMPVHDASSILAYDARLLKYVLIYDGRYTFGNSLCHGIISFVSKKGRLSNFTLDEGSKLVSYTFPQDHPHFIVPQENTSGTIYWNPNLASSSSTGQTAISIKVPTTQGNYSLIWQGIDSNGKSIRKMQTLHLE